MKIGLICAVNGHYKPLMQALEQGIVASGDEALPASINTPRGFDAIVCWGWRTGKRIRQVAPQCPVLVMERGYVGDRFFWTSLGWNGLNGRAVFPRPPRIDVAEGERACHARWVDNFANQHEKPWYYRRPEGGYALILGQVQGDQACQMVNLASQYRTWATVFLSQGREVRYRAHPKALHQRSGLTEKCRTAGTLAEDLAGAAFTISWNSNSSVDSVLAGVPSVTLDRGAMAWAVTSHDLNNPVTMPSRTDWAAQLAWCQWQPAELADGSAWRAVRECMP